MLNIPTIVTEHYPKVFGKTVPEFNLSQKDTSVFQKTSFSMISGPVLDSLKEDRIKGNNQVSFIFYDEISFSFLFLILIIDYFVRY